VENSLAVGAGGSEVQKPSKTQARLFGFLMVFCYCMMIVISKYSKSRGVELAFVRGVSGIVFSLVYNIFHPEPFYFREGYAMEKFMVRGFLGALTFTIQMTANQLLNSAIFIVMSRMKVFFTLILSTLFNSDEVDIRLIILTVVAFIGVCLVMDPSIFGLPTLSDPMAIRIIGLPKEIFAIGLCVIYMIISSVSRAVMYYATIEMNNTQAFFILSIFNIINSSVVFIWQPMVWRTDEIFIYIAISVTSIMFIYAFLFFLTYEQDMLIFIMIQTSIVGMTFLIDITLFGTQFNAYNLIGVLLVIAASFSVLLL
jgi:drug/metabolite transporter (DMT)-like permease